MPEIRCPWCNNKIMEEHEWLDEDSDYNDFGILKKLKNEDVWIFFCDGCEGFFKAEVKYKTTKMKLIEVKNSK